VDEITNGLKRLVTGVLTHPMTIGKVRVKSSPCQSPPSPSPSPSSSPSPSPSPSPCQVISAHTLKRKKDKPKSIHLVGTDTPEVRRAKRYRSTPDQTSFLDEI
jgi:hypothetical protein